MRMVSGFPYGPVYTVLTDAWRWCFIFAVLTKVFVYCGIGILASGGMPIFFELIGWGMRVR